MKQQIIMHRKTMTGYEEIYPDASADNILTNQTIANNVGVDSTDAESVLESVSATDKMISGYGITGGTASAYTVDLVGKEDMTPVDGMMIKVKFHVDSNEEPTINVNGSGAKNIFTENGLKVLGKIGVGAWVLLMKSDKLNGWVMQGWCKRRRLYTEIFTSSTTWTPPDDVKMVTVRLFGGGGGGGYGTSVGAGGGGGGGHMTVASFSVKNQPYAITVGAGGTPNANGGVTSFSNLASANGGSCSGVFTHGGDGGTGGGGGNSENSKGIGGNGSYGGGGGGSSKGGKGGNGGIYGGGGGGTWGSDGGSGRNGMYAGGAGKLHNGGGGGGYSEKGHDGATTGSDGGAGGNGENTTSLLIDFTGTGLGGKGSFLRAGGGGGGYGGEGGWGIDGDGAGGGGGYGGNGGSNPHMANYPVGGGGGGGYGGNGGDGDFGGGGGGGYGGNGNGGSGGGGYGTVGGDGGIAAGGGGGGRNSGSGGSGGNGVCIITYYSDKETN